MFGFGVLWILLCVAAIVLVRWLYKYCYGEACVDIKILSVFVLVLVMFWQIIAAYYVETIGADLCVQRAELAIYENRVKDLLPQLSAELKSYPPYEKSVLSKFTGNGNQVVVIPPQLRASETTMQVVAEIKDARDKCYGCKLKMATSRRDLAVAYRIGGWAAVYLPNTD